MAAAQILVTGATGNVGAEVVRLLSGLEQPFVIGARDVVQARQHFGEVVPVVCLDFEHPDTFPAAFKDIKKIFLVRPPQLADSKKYFDPAIRAAKEAGVEHVVFLSLLGVEKNRLVPHYRIEQSLRQSGMAWTFLRAGFFMQNLSTTHRAEIRERSELFIPAGKGRTSFIDVRDIAEVAVKALAEDNHRNRAYNLTGAEGLDYYQVAEQLSRVLDRPVRYSAPSAPVFAWKGFRAKQPPGLVLVMTALYTLARFGRAATVTTDLEKLLGRQPTTFGRFAEDYRTTWL